jgi:hypothetical protein
VGVFVLTGVFEASLLNSFIDSLELVAFHASSFSLFERSFGALNESSYFTFLLRPDGIPLD